MVLDFTYDLSFNHRKPKTKTIPRVFRKSCFQNSATRVPLYRKSKQNWTREFRVVYLLTNDCGIVKALLNMTYFGISIWDFCIRILLIILEVLGGLLGLWVMLCSDPYLQIVHRNIHYLGMQCMVLHIPYRCYNFCIL